MRAWALAGLVLLGCGTTALPPPEIRSVQPDTAEASASTEVSVRVDAVLPFHADYGAPDSGVDDTAKLVIGNLAVGSGHYGDAGVLAGTLPSILTPGDYDVSLVLGDGRQAVAKSAFHVTAGEWPTTYSVDDVPDQKAGTPFEITLHANGANGPGFHGNIELQSSRGSITPSLSGAFDAGVLVQQVTLDQPAQNVVILVFDTNGLRGASNPFTVSP